MFDQQARIKLAEAIGWRCVDARTGDLWVDPNETMNVSTTNLPDPFTDANDDYAVLEWVKDRPFSFRSKFWNVFDVSVSRQGKYKVAWPDAMQFYQIGDYARAALKVIDEARNV